MRRLIPLLLAPSLAFAQTDEGDLPPPAPAAEAAESAGPPLPDDPDVAVGRAAYNAQKYADAVKAFQSVARRHPQSAGVYRALARAASWAGQPETAVRAYRHYLQLAPKAGDAAKVEAELKLAERKLPTPLAEGPPADVASALTAVRERAAADRFAGEDGALAALDTLLAMDYVGPELADARAAVDQTLRARTDELIGRWWAPEATASKEALAAMAAGWAARARRGALDYEASRMSNAVAGLQQLAAGQFAEAVETLGPVAPGDLRLRYAQAVALARAERHVEAEQLLTALSREADDPRVAALLGLVRRAQGRIDHALDAWRIALEPPTAGEG